MKSVVFLRGVNVGGKRKFQPTWLAQALAGFDAANIGAAGTLVIRGPADPAAVRQEIERLLPFQTQSRICTAEQFLSLLQLDPLAGDAERFGAERYLSVLMEPPEKFRRLPISLPDPESWTVQLGMVSDPFVVSLRRRGEPGRLYPNEAVERCFDVPATTRNWNTVLKVARLLAGT
jgi:uncharacterized protein (DUF1697 family)